MKKILKERVELVVVLAQSHYSR